MALNPFFLQGSPGEQRLIQNLINEQLQIYGVEVNYIQRVHTEVDKHNFYLTDRKVAHALQT